MSSQKSEVRSSKYGRRLGSRHSRGPHRQTTFEVYVAQPFRAASGIGRPEGLCCPRHVKSEVRSEKLEKYGRRLGSTHSRGPHRQTTFGVYVAQPFRAASGIV